MRRNWIKIYVDQCLRGTMMDEMKDPGERFLWFAFLLLAGDSPYEGKIALTEDMGYTDEQLGSMLKCDPGLIQRAKKVMVKYDKIKVLKNNIIQIVNWKKYQSEYQRQKPYRSDDGQKLLRKVTTKGDDIEREGEIEIDRDVNRDRDLEEDTEILTLLQKVKNYPFKREEDLKFIEGLKTEFPNVDILEKVKQVTINWLKFPLTKKSRPRVQIRRWVTNEQKWQKEGTKEKKVGESMHIPSKKEDDYMKARTIKMKDIQSKYQPEIDKAMKTKSRDWMDEIDNKMKEEIAEFSREYHKEEL
jgi:hypothetical protein